MGRAHALLALMVLCTPAVAAEVDITLYFHVNGFLDYPINAQRPADVPGKHSDGSLPSGCVETALGSFSSYSKHTWYGYNTPSKVEYDVLENGRPRVYHERGLNLDLELRGEAIAIHWFLEGVTEAGGETSPEHPPIPDVIVRAIVREGDDVSVSNEAFNMGAIIAQAQTEPVTLAREFTQETDQVKVHTLGERSIYEFILVAPIENPVIDRDEAFNVRIDAFVDEPVCDGPTPGEDGDYAMPANVIPHASTEFQPRLHLVVNKTVAITSFDASVNGDTLRLDAWVSGHLGNYHVLGSHADEPPIVFELRGADQALNVSTSEPQRTHGNQFSPPPGFNLWGHVDVTRLRGQYDVVLSISNDQGTDTAEVNGTLTVDGDVTFCHAGVCEVLLAGEKESPAGPGGLVALAALALLRRR